MKPLGKEFNYIELPNSFIMPTVEFMLTYCIISTSIEKYQAHMHL